MRHLDEHLDDGIIHALLDGELSGEELAAARAHVLACDACSARVAEERLLAGEAERLIAELDEAAASPADEVVPLPESPTVKGPPVVLIPEAGEEPNRWQRRKPPSRWIGIAAMLVVAAGAGLVALQSGPDDAAFGTDAVVSDMELPRPEGQGFALTDSAAPVPAPDAVPAAGSALASGTGGPPAETAARKLNDVPGTELAGTSAGNAPRESPARAASTQSSERVENDARSERAEEPAARPTELAQGARSAERSAVPSSAPAEPRAARDEDVASVMQMRPGVTAGAAAPAPETRRRDSLRVPAAPTVATPAPRRAPLSLEEQSQISMRIGLDEAQRLLGSPMHVIDGLQPEFVGLVPGRLVRGANPNDYVVRVVYLDEQRRKIYLDQQRLDLTGRQLGLQRDTVPPEWVKGEVRLSLSGDISSDAARALARRVR
jgi:hypothetical protein